MIGPTLGGILVSYVGWWWIFYVNVPIAIVAVVLASASLHTNAEATKIVNYSQWETREAWAAAMERRAEVQPFAQKVRELAESFDRAEYDVVFAHGK